MNKTYKLILLFLLILAILLNIIWLKLSVLGLIFGFAYLIIFGFLLGKNLLPDFKPGSQIVFGIFGLTASYSLLGAITYFAYALNQGVVSFMLVIISGLIIWLDLKKQRKQEFKLKIPKITITRLSLTLSYLILVAISFWFLWQGQTGEAINSPWQVITPNFFIVYFIATIALVLLIIYCHNYLSTIFLVIHFSLTTSIALIIYQLGYGFDPFIHRATELAIWQNGFILPKPFYYLGQYSIVIFLVYLFQVSVELIDKLLVPILMAIFLPYITYYSLYKAFGWPKYICRLLSLSLLFLPFGLFIVTTPQAVANIFTIIILFLSFLYLRDKNIPFWYLIFLTLATLAIHALAGIPILIYLIIIWLLQNKSKANKIILPIFVIISSLALPLALILNSIISIYKVELTWQNFSFLTLPNILSKQFNFFLDLAYLYKHSICILFIIIAVITLIHLVKQKKSQLFIGSILVFVILIINSLLLQLIKVSFIIDYEQGFFSQRVNQLAFYFLLPVVIYGLYIIINRIFNNNLLYKYFLVIFVAIFITCSLYLSYPRFDDYENSKFVNLSQTDLEAVEFIENNSDGQKYIALANQMTSAAALKTFGFTKYYNGHYFYPIPTGGQLYGIFEKMIYEQTSRETMIEAMELTGVNQAYFVLPSYWSQFELLKEKAQKETDEIYNLKDKISIFKFSK